MSRFIIKTLPGVVNHSRNIQEPLVGISRQAAKGYESLKRIIII